MYGDVFGTNWTGVPFASRYDITAQLHITYLISRMVRLFQLRKMHPVLGKPGIQTGQDRPAERDAPHSEGQKGIYSGCPLPSRSST